MFGMRGTQDNELDTSLENTRDIKKKIEALKPDTMNSKKFIKRKVIRMKKRNIEF